MRILNKAFGSAAALALGLLVGATPAAAQNTNLKEVGAALTLPVLTDYLWDTITLAVVTNVAPESRILHVNVIDGKTWKAKDFSCFVTASETTLFKFIPAPDWTSDVHFECTNPATLEPVEFWDTIDTDAGFMFVSLEDPETGQTINENGIFGDATIINFVQGAAYSVGAISFQGGTVNGGGDPDMLGDRNYRFDGEEYSKFPSVLATNFISPTTGGRRGVGVTAELILLTLDGTTDNNIDDLGPAANFSITFYDDDERHFSSSWLFCCFDIVDLETIDTRFNRSTLGSVAGHMFMEPQIQQQPDPGHDFLYDGGVGYDGMRRTPVHGWLVQTVFHTFRVYPDGPPLALSRAAWARTLNQSTTDLVPSTGDVPTLATNQ